MFLDVSEEPSSTITISKDDGKDSNRKLSKSSCISCGLLYTGIIKEYSKCIPQKYTIIPSFAKAMEVKEKKPSR